MADCTYRVDDLTDSGDALYGPRICNQPFIEYAWVGHGFNYDYWQDGWGWDDCCNIRKPLARTFNALWLLGYSADDWANEEWSSSMLHWAPRYVREQLMRYEDLRADCGDGGANARTTGCQWTRSFAEWKCTEWRRDQHEECDDWHWLIAWLCILFVTVISWFCVLWGWVSTAACTLWYGTVGGSQNVTLFLPFFYTNGGSDVRDVIARAGTLVHEARHIGEKPHNADFPAGSLLGSGSGADASWGYEGAFMYQALYLWWFYEDGTRTTIALRDSAKTRANFIINNGFAEHPGFVVS
jgi:hypothetical protein